MATVAGGLINNGNLRVLLARTGPIGYALAVSDAGLATPDRDERIAALEALLAERDAALADARVQLHSRDLLIGTLRAQLAKLRHMQFGHSSEKLSRQIEQLELTLEELEAEAVAAAPDRAPPLAAERPAPVRALPPHLPRDEVVHEPATGACACPSCGGVLRLLGRDADELLDVAPVSWRVLRHVRPKYSCRSCERIVQAPAPAKAVARGKATFATLAHVVVSKFDHHLPLYRQAEMMAAQGLDLDRSTLAGWVGQAAALLDPIVSRIREEGLKAGKLHTDDTPVPVLDPGRGRTAQGRLWVYAVDDRGCGAATSPLVWYRFTADRSGLHPQRELAGFSGHLQADAYAGYHKLYQTGRVVEVACWAHFRRGIVDEHRSQPTALTTDLLDRIGQLYAVEAGIRGKPPDVRARTRQDSSRPVVDALRGVIDEALRRLSPRSEMAKALRYGVKLWPALTRFLDDGRLEIDNGVAERALRGVAVGRRNWLFAGSLKGGERAAALYPVIEPAKAHGRDPPAYIAGVLAQLVGGWPAAQWDDLMPWNWALEPVRLAA